MVCVRPLGTNFKYLKDAQFLILINKMQLLSAGLKEIVNWSKFMLQKSKARL